MTVNNKEKYTFMIQTLIRLKDLQTEPYMRLVSSRFDELTVTKEIPAHLTILTKLNSAFCLITNCLKVHISSI